MSCVIRIWGWMIDRPCDITGHYVASVDVQAYTRPSDPSQPASEMVKDWLQTTVLQDLAYRWESSEAAMRTYREILKSDPTRPDGKPNRPFTALSIEVIPVFNFNEDGTWRSGKSR